MRNNPRNRYQIQCTLWDGNGGFCALGFALDSLEALPEDRDAYQEPYYDVVYELLDITQDEAMEIWAMNDRQEMLLPQIADALEEKWRNN